MVDISDEDFEKLIAEAIDNLPEKYLKQMNNVAVTWEDFPNPTQREKLKLGPHQTLFGLYEGVPRTNRGGSNNLVLPDKITLFKLPLAGSVHSIADLKEQIRHTLWHEVAHYFGLDHKEIHERE